MKAAPQDTPIPFDQLAAPAQRALRGGGFLTLQQLAGAEESEIAQLHGIGPNALKVLKKAMNARKLSFAKSHESR